MVRRSLQKAAMFAAFCLYHAGVTEETKLVGIYNVGDGRYVGIRGGKSQAIIDLDNMIGLRTRTGRRQIMRTIPRAGQRVTPSPPGTS